MAKGTAARVREEEERVGEAWYYPARLSGYGTADCMVGSGLLVALCGMA